MKSSLNTSPALRKARSLSRLESASRKRAADGRDLLQFLRRQVVEVLVHRRAGIDLVRDAVEARHQHRREGEIGVGRRVGEAHLDALGLRVRRPRNTARGRAVARRIGEQHRRLVAGHEPLVAVGRRVGEAVQRLGVLDDAADVIEALLAEVGIFVAGHDRLAALPDRLVDVHARAIVAEDRLRHEGRRLAVALRDHVDAVFVDLHVVGHRRQRAELEAELMLGRGDLVVVLLDHRAHLRHRRQHLAAHVLRRILRRHREIAALGADAVAEVAALVSRVGVGRQFDRVDLEAGIVGLGGEAHVVEHEELGLGAEEDRVADAGRLEIGLGLLGDAARIAVVGLAARGIENVAVDDHRRGGEERVHAGRGRVGHQRHVGLVDRLPAGDRRTVEHEPVGEGVVVDQRLIEGDMLPLAPRIGEAEIDIFDVVVLDRLQDILGGLHHLPFLND